MGKFVIRHTAAGYKFDLCADNGESIASSEVYGSEAACRRGIASVGKNGKTEKLLDLTEPAGALTNPKFELFQDRGGEFRFRLRARNGEIILASQGYCTKSGCRHGVACVRAHCGDQV